MVAIVRECFTGLEILGIMDGQFREANGKIGKRFLKILKNMGKLLEGEEENLVRWAEKKNKEENKQFFLVIFLRK